MKQYTEADLRAWLELKNWLWWIRYCDSVELAKRVREGEK